MAIKTREDKGSALTHAELDNNFTELEKYALGMNQNYKLADYELNVTHANESFRSMQLLFTYGVPSSSWDFTVEIDGIKMPTGNGGAISPIIPPGSTFKIMAYNIVNLRIRELS